MESKFPIDWGEFEKFMLKQFPFLPKDFMSGDIVRNPFTMSDSLNKDIHSFVDKVMNQAPFRNGINYDLHDTLNKIIIKFHIPKKTPRNDIRLSVNRRKVRLRLGQNQRQEVQLPNAVSPKRSHALYKNGILEVHMPKLREPKQFHDIRVP